MDEIQERKRSRRRLVHLFGPAGHEIRRHSGSPRNRNATKHNREGNPQGPQSRPLHHEQFRNSSSHVRKAAAETSQVLRQKNRHSLSRYGRNRLQHPASYRLHSKNRSRQPSWQKTKNHPLLVGERVYHAPGWDLGVGWRLVESRRATQTPNATPGGW